MRFELHIQCDNAAFDDLNGELSRILNELAKTYTGGRRTIFDLNGNAVGEARLVRESTDNAEQHSLDLS